MTRRWNVLLPPTIDPVGPESLADVADCTSRADYADEEALLADVDRYDAIITRTQPVSAELIGAADRLKVVAKHGAGVDNVDVEAATDRGILVANTPGENANSVAEHAVTLLLAAKRNVVRADRATRKGDWRRADFRGRDLFGRTLGLFGAGNAGRRVATLLSGFGVSCVAYDPYVDPADLPENVSLVDEPTDLFERADDVSVHAPLTDETYHAVGAAEIGALPADAVLVNTARGGVVDEDALVAALREETIAGAGVDVYETEPPEPDDPLLECDSAVFTQHNAGVSVDALENMSRAAAGVVRTVHAGGVPETTLNPEAVE
ncbi:hydroxyacid dehydrogenase [Halorubrum rubrum]|uniref:Hydroxyacid dehydrogenase n=1 Tax=Halorubrum rubrum TaxID=1126240 RepID=A0ABD5R1S9_9EURY|nr:hydroxyacid dehydrogenase [Halorubrum rubrum]